MRRSADVWRRLCCAQAGAGLHLTSNSDGDWDVPLAQRLGSAAGGSVAAVGQTHAAAARSVVQAGQQRRGGLDAPPQARRVFGRGSGDDDDDDDDDWMRAAGAPVAGPATHAGAAAWSDCEVLSDSDVVYELPASGAAAQRSQSLPTWEEDDDPDSPVLATQTERTAKVAPRGTTETKAAEKARRAEERRRATAQRKEDKEAQKAANAAARQEHRAATGKLATQQITAVIDSRLASTAVGRAIGAALDAAKFAHTVALLPVEHSVCWVRHAARTAAWAGALPWPGATAAAAAAREGAAAVPYVLLVFEAARLTAAVQQHGGLEHLVPAVRAAHPSATLCVCGIGVQAYLRSRERSEFSSAFPTSGFSRDGVDAALARLVTHVRGVRQRLAKDIGAAAEHGVLLTDALAKQPFRSEESFLALFGGERKGGKFAVAPAPDDDPDAGVAASAARKRPRELSLPEAWLSALARVPGSSMESATAIARVYPSMAALIAAYRVPGLADADAKQLLANLTRDAAVPGGKTRRVGPACSERMWKLFRARPPHDAGLEEL